jgi:hypothetical protein|tara:strand:- start:604 stop:831 length:228 start_codon:yes stop_codon:yes gene_type:complete
LDDSHLGNSNALRDEARHGGRGAGALHRDQRLVVAEVLHCDVIPTSARLERRKLLLEMRHVLHLARAVHDHMHCQ